MFKDCQLKQAILDNPFNPSNSEDLQNAMILFNQLDQYALANQGVNTVEEIIESQVEDLFKPQGIA